MLAKLDPEIRKKIWAGDHLDRWMDAESLIGFLPARLAERERLGRTKSYVLNLNAPWGSGKTFFLERFGKQLEAQGYLHVYINAWRDDHAESPMVSVMAGIQNVLDPFTVKERAANKIKKVARNAGKELTIVIAKAAFEQAAKRLVGDENFDVVRDIALAAGIEDEKLQEKSDAIIEKLTNKLGDTLIKQFKERSSSISDFKRNLGNLLQAIAEKGDKRLPLFVLVDELDRCRPTYAISMLEQIKHLFDVENVVFVIASDTEQLSHSVRAVYGAGFEAENYLTRFFDRTFVFHEIGYGKYVESLFKLYDIQEDRLLVPPGMSAAKYFLKYRKSYELDLRSIDQCFDILRSIITIWNYPVPLNLLYLLPLIMSHQQPKRRAEFKSLEKFGLPSLTSDWRHEFISSIGQRETVPNTELLSMLLSRTKSGIQKALEERVDRPSLHWMRSIFEQEQMAMLSYTKWDRRKTLLTQYPHLVRTAAQFTLYNNEADEE